MIRFASIVIFVVVYSMAAYGEFIKNFPIVSASQYWVAGDQDLNIPLFGREKTGKTKSKLLAGLYSLILPGAGQYYAGQISKTKVYAGIESGLWLTVVGFREYGSLKKDAARGWAILKAGASPFNNDDRYWTKLTYYDNRDFNEPDGFGYNQMIRVIDGENALVFPETPEYYWNWDSRQSREHYRQLRNQSKTAYRRSGLVIGAVIMNHVVSAIDAFISTGKLNRRLEFSGMGLDYQLSVSSGHPYFYIGLSKSIN